MCSPAELFKVFISFASLIGLTILSHSEIWFCDGTFKSSPTLFYQSDTWVKKDATFPREIWNFHEQSSHRTNNICETYNKKINTLLTKAKPNIFKLIDLLKDQEVLTTVDYGKANLGKKKSRRTKEDLKDREIEILKLKYKFGEIDS